MTEASTALCNWCNENAMTVNTEKTSYQIFTLSHKQPTPHLKISNTPVVQTQDARYLGLYLGGKLTWRNYIEKTIEKLK
jgi:hypothetical protein